MLFLGVDLAWGDATAKRPANESGLVALDGDGVILEAGWTRGTAETLAWLEQAAADEPNVLVAVDAPLVVTNATSQRACEKQVGQRYGRWQVSANTTNRNSPRQAGVALLEHLEALGYAYTDGWDGPTSAGRHVFECYPFTTLVGVEELGYDQERPRYKRPPKGLKVAAWRPVRAANFDELVRRVQRLAAVDPPLDLASHPTTAALLIEAAPFDERAYKHREDLLDAALCAWTAALWHRHGTNRCQVLGEPGSNGRAPTMIAPARPEQRR